MTRPTKKLREILEQIRKFFASFPRKTDRNFEILSTEPKSEKSFDTKIIQPSKNLSEDKQDRKEPIFLDITRDRDKIAEMASKYGLDVASVLAVAEVESAGRSGFQKTGLLTVLFEAHIFYSELKKVGLNPDVLMDKYSHLILPTWNRKLYRGGDYENSRLAEALKIHDCAWNCASYGMFQIMGFNYKACGFNTVREFVGYLKTGQEAHIDAFLKFVSADSRKMSALKNKNWAIFARLYNGPRYAENEYDIKLAAAYKKHSEIT